jgi:transposase
MPRDQLVLIPTALEEIIGEDHPVRMVDEILDRLDWSEWEATYHGSCGQPPIHPSVLAKVMLFAMIRRVRSSRQIEYELKHSIDFIWLASGRHIDHTTLSEFRRKNSGELRDIFRQMIKLAMDLNVANLSELCIDGTRVLANARKYRTWTAAKVEKLLSELDAQLLEALAVLESSDQLDKDLLGDDVSADQLPPELRDMKARRELLAEHLEQLQQMDTARSKQGTDPKKNPAQIPKTDPDSRILPSKEGGYAANYTPMATVESQNGFIVMPDVMIGNVEHDQFGSIVDTVTSDFDVEINRVLADTAYTTGENLTEAEERDIELIGPMAEVKCDNNPAHRDDHTQPVAEEDLDRLPINATTKRFDKSAFVYDEQEDCYYCPAGKRLPHRCNETVDRGNRKVARRVYTCKDCAGCPIAERCRKNPEAKKGREVLHDSHEGVRRRHRERMKTPEAKQAYARRQSVGEMPFAVIKACFDMRRFLLRGIDGVRQEWLWAATAFNLKKLSCTWMTLRADISKEAEIQS